MKEKSHDWIKIYELKIRYRNRVYTQMNFNPGNLIRTLIDITAVVNCVTICPQS